MISELISEKWQTAHGIAELDYTEISRRISGPFWPCGLLGTGASLFEEHPQFYEYRAFFRVHDSSTLGDHLDVIADMKILLTYPKDPRDSSYIWTWELSPVCLCSMTQAWLDRCKRKHHGVCGTKEKLCNQNCLPFQGPGPRRSLHRAISEQLSLLTLSNVWGPPGATSAWLTCENISQLGAKGGLV